jgi:hypothetical protein
MFVLISCKGQEIPAEAANGENWQIKYNPNCTIDSNNNLNAPTSITDAVDFINSLPKPLELPCLIQNLKRPLAVNMTLSMASAQPAVGQDTPRIFIISGKLILSIVPDGSGKHLLELTELLADDTSIKGELDFPIASDIAASAPYSRITVGERTTCKACHRGEELFDTMDDGTKIYSSVAIKPTGSFTVDDINYESYICDNTRTQNYRCSMIRSLVDHGEIYWEDFPAAMPTWLESLL